MFTSEAHLKAVRGEQMDERVEWASTDCSRVVLAGGDRAAAAVLDAHEELARRALRSLSRRAGWTACHCRRRVVHADVELILVVQIVAGVCARLVTLAKRVLRGPGERVGGEFGPDGQLASTRVQHEVLEARHVAIVEHHAGDRINKLRVRALVLIVSLNLCRVPKVLFKSNTN